MRTLLVLALLLTPSLAHAEAPASARRESSAEARLLVVDESPELSDGFAPPERRRIEAAVAAYRARRPQVLKSHRPFLFTFFPQAGVPGRDLFLQHFADLDPSTELLRDWDCSSYTYDGHRGHDSRIRSFREQEIGVPIFAAHDGVVIATHDGEPDRNTLGESPLSNYVVLDHGGGYDVWYGHLKLGSVAVSPGQAVAAGKQIGLTASSGQSVWPHLHLETHLNGNWIEPSAGPCHPGDSLWADQPPVTRELYAVGFYLSPDRLPLAGSNLGSHRASPDRTAVLDDEFRRAGSFVKGRQRIDARVDLRNLPGGATHRVRVLDPKGNVALESEGVYEDRGPLSLVVAFFSVEVDLATPGVWRFQLELDDTRVVDAPFQVVASARQVVNRAPSKIGVRFPTAPAAGEAALCEVVTSLLGRDPDYDLVRYRYEWRSGSKLLRAVTSAASTDLLAADLVRAGDRLSCRATPSDGKRFGKPAVAKAVVGRG